jgi:ATP-dependent DNA helicase RecG
MTDLAGRGLPPTGMVSDQFVTKVLLLEREQGYRNRSVTSGLSRFAQQIHAAAKHDSILPEVALALANYDSQPQRERVAALSRALSLLGGAQEQITQPAMATAATEVTRARSPRQPPTPIKSRPKAKPITKVSALDLSTPLSRVKGMPAATAAALETLGVVTVRDLLGYFPREHLDFRRQDRIGQLRIGERTTLIGKVVSVQNRRVRKQLTITQAILQDDSGRATVRWFNQPYLAKNLQLGRLVAVTGEAQMSDGWPTFVPRDYEFVTDEELTHGARLAPVYPLTKGLHQRSLRALVKRVVDEAVDLVEDYLPSEIRTEYDLPTESVAIANYHFPADAETLRSARTRLVFDELFAVSIGVLERKTRWKLQGDATKLRLSDDDIAEFLGGLKFDLTKAQKRAIRDVRADLAQDAPMNRLIQGDVGSGKTVVAAIALYAAAIGGHQGILMAPTEILARQHFANLVSWLSVFGLDVQLLVGSTTAAHRRELAVKAKTGRLDVLVGTHALFEESVDFVESMAVAVIDEQHRFGVGQRARLREKGKSPHLLSMTATPIPRTLQLTVFGDLDITVIDELPPGRQPALTQLVSQPGVAYDQIREEVAEGRQAFVVCPLIDESADDDIRSVVAEHKHLSETVFPDLKIGLLHGRMKPREKDKTILAFRDKLYDVLVATSLVEVGIDIPNATVMVIRDAERFGLAQLHQLRGRIGRGGTASYCVLVSDIEFGPGLDRLRAVVGSTDGFELAEEDLRQRGPGEFWGTRQSGLPALKVAGPAELSKIAPIREIAETVLKADPDLSQARNQGIRDHVRRYWHAEAELH